MTEQAKFNAPVLNANGSVTLTWTGTGTFQQSAKPPTVTTDWSDVATSGNTYTVTPDPANPQKYYRIKQ